MIAMQIFNLGLGTATFKHVAAHAGLKDFEKVSSTINTNFSLSSLLHILCVLSGLSISIAMRYFSLFKIEPAYIDLVCAGTLLGSILVGFKFYEQIIGYTFKALERFDLDTFLSTGLKLSVLTINILLVFLGFGLVALFIASIACSFINLIISFVVIKKQIPGFEWRFKLNKINIMQELNFAIWPWFQTLAIIITFQCDRFFVVTFVGLATLTYYGLAATMFNHIHMGFNAIVPWLAPKITKMKTIGEDPEALYRSARNFSLLLSLSALLIFSLVNEPILSLLLSKTKYAAASEFIRLFTVFEIFFVFSIVPNYFLNAAGFEKMYFKIVLFYCISIMSGMAIGYFTTHTAGGIIMGMTASTALTMFIQNWIISQQIFKGNGLKEAFILYLPPFLLSWAIMSSDKWLQFSLYGLTILSLHFVFTRHQKINFNLLKID